MFSLLTLNSNSRDVSEGLDDTIFFVIDEAGSPALDMATVSHFAFASSHSLRGVNLLISFQAFSFFRSKTASLVFM